MLLNKKIVKIILTIILVPLCFYQIYTLRSYKQSDQVLNNYNSVKNQLTEKIAVENFGITVPAMWTNNAITHKEVIDKMRNFYINESKSNFDYSDEIIGSTSEDSYCILKKDSFFVNLNVISVSDMENFVLETSQMDFKKQISDLDPQSKEIEIVEQLDEYNNDDFTYVMFSIKQSDLKSQYENGYVAAEYDKKAKKVAILTAAASDEYSEKYPCIDRLITNSLNIKGEKHK